MSISATFGHRLCKTGEVAGTTNGCLAALRWASACGIKVPASVRELLRSPADDEALIHAMKIADALVEHRITNNLDKLIGNTVSYVPEVNAGGFLEATQLSLGGAGHTPKGADESILETAGIA